MENGKGKSVVAEATAAAVEDDWGDAEDVME